MGMMAIIVHGMRNVGALFAALTCAALFGAGSAKADGWPAIVIGQPGSSAPRAFADAFHAAEALESGSFTDVTLLRDVSLIEIAEAVTALAGRDRALIYLTGPLAEGGQGIAVKDGALGFENLLDMLAGAGVTETALLVEACPDNGEALRLPAPRVDMAMLRAASSPPGSACGAERLTDILAQSPDAPVDLMAHLEGAWVSSDLETPLTMLPFAAQAAPVTSVVAAGAVTIAPINPTVSRNLTITPVSFTPASQPAATGEVVIFAPPPQSQLAAQPVAAGLPQPSIIVGLLNEAVPAAFETVTPPGEVTSNEISYENLEARRALREQDSALFAALVAGGAFDPPANLLPTALQTELARMGCYRAGIDGQWGPGSRGSVTRYFDEIDGETAVSLDPTIDLFRQIMMQDDITCAAPVAAAATPRATPARTTTTRQTTQRTRTQAAPQPARRQPQTSSPSLSGTNRLGGVFR